MKISCGILLINTEDNVILGCKPTNRPHGYYDVPKGELDENETPLECAIRETREETGLVIPENILTDLGEFDYLPNKKRLHLFKCEYIIEDLSKLMCISHYYDEKRMKHLPEVSSYDLISFDELDKFYPSLYLILKNIVKKN